MEEKKNILMIQSLIKRRLWYNTDAHGTYWLHLHVMLTAQ